MTESLVERNAVAFVAYSYFKWARHIACDIIGYKPKKKKGR